MTLPVDSIFDTLVDTSKIYVSMRTKFIPRKYENKEKFPVYLHITSKGKRERVHLDVFVNPENWDKNNQRIKNPTPEEQDLNLILDNYQAKVTNIKTVYRLSEKILSPIMLKKELKDGLPRVNFVAFFKTQLVEDKILMKKGTWRRYYSVYHKLKKFKKEIIFTEIDYRFFTDYRKYWKKKGNVNTTINSNIKVLKKYLKVAIKFGIKIPLDLDEIKVGSTLGSRTSLLPYELKRADAYYFSEFINKEHKLILGYFLFACMTGLRISDVQSLERFQLLDEQFSFNARKSKKDQVISLNKKAMEIIKECPDLFIAKYTNEHINREIKKIFTFLKIKKKITFHVSRHTFATNFLRMGGAVQKLQILLGHSDLKQTMIYVHIVAEEANKEIFLLDNLF